MIRLLAIFLLATAAVSAADRGVPVIRIWGNPAMSELVAQWQVGFARERASVKFATHLTGSDTAMAGLCTGRADIALLGRSCTSSEMQAFEWVFRYKPVQIEIMNGSLDHAGKSAALVFFVHVDNPLTELTPSQLAAVLGGGPDAIRTWDGLGMHGEWSGRRINLYLPDLTSGTGKFLQEALLNGKKTMTWDHLKEFSDREKFQSPTHDAGAQIITALVDDRFGLGLASAAFSSARVRPLALRVAASEPPVSATRDSIVAGHYPLARVAVACVNRPPGATLDPMVREFITYILSEEGQRVAEQNGYLPLAENHRSDQRRKL